MLVPEIEEVKYEIVGKLIHPRKIAKIINEIIFHAYGAEVRASSSSKNIDISDLIINAYFEHDDWDSDNNIEIHIMYSSKVRKGITINEDGWTIFQFKLYQALQHEIIHRKQAEKRTGFDPWIYHRNNYEGWYFQDPDEIEAHAHDIVLDLLFFGLTIDEAIEKLKNYKQITLSESITMFVYMTYFKFDLSNKHFRKLIKKTVKFLEEKRE